MGDPEVAHIFPYSILNTPPPSEEWRVSDLIPDFWTLLYVFWDRDRVDTWRRKINTGFDEPFNLICLTPDAHDMWNMGQFALKPLELSSDNTELTVKFFWQVPNKYQPASRIDLLTEPASSEGLGEGAGRWLAHKDSGSSEPYIHSGQVFTFKTTGPKNLPLPSMELLEMQWYLQRSFAWCCWMAKHRLGR